MLYQFLEMVIKKVNEEKKVTDQIGISVEEFSSSFQSILEESEELKRLSMNLKTQSDGLLTIVNDFKL